VQSLVQFIQSLLQSAPSSSVQDPRSLLTQVLLDVIWTADSGVEDKFPNAKTAPTTDPGRIAYDQDRQRLAELVKSLIVRVAKCRVVRAGLILYV
jgi:hypothetical protein